MGQERHQLPDFLHLELQGRRLLRLRSHPSGQLLQAELHGDGFARVQHEEAEVIFLHSCFFPQDHLVQPHGVIVVVETAVEGHTQDFGAAVHPPDAPHGHLLVQAVEVLVGQRTGRALPPGSLGTLVAPGRALEEVIDLENPLFSQVLVQKKEDGYSRKAAAPLAVPLIVFLWRNPLRHKEQSDVGADPLQEPIQSLLQKRGVSCLGQKVHSHQRVSSVTHGEASLQNRTERDKLVLAPPATFGAAVTRTACSKTKEEPSHSHALQQPGEVSRSAHTCTTQVAVPRHGRAGSKALRSPQSPDEGSNVRARSGHGTHATTSTNASVPWGQGG